MNGTDERTGSASCGCSAEASAPREEQRARPAIQPKLEDLVPIAVVIAAGCEPCAERMVRRALEQGSAPEHIAKVLGIVAHMQKLDCLLEAVGAEAVAHMEKPLAAGRRTLQQAKLGACH